MEKAIDKIVYFNAACGVLGIILLVTSQIFLGRNAIVVGIIAINIVVMITLSVVFLMLTWLNVREKDQ